MRWEEVEAALTREKLVFSPVLSVAQTTQDPQANAAGCYVDLPGDDGTSMRVPATPIDFGAARPTPRRAPALNADGDAIRAELGIPATA